MPTNRKVVTSEEQKQAVLAKINDYTQKGFPEAKRLHEIIMAANPGLQPRLWYGMPGYAKTKDSAVLCFFRKDDLISFGITESVDVSMLSDEPMVPSAWYITELTQATESQVNQIVTRATQ